MLPATISVVLEKYVSNLTSPCDPPLRHSPSSDITATYYNTM